MPDKEYYVYRLIDPRNKNTFYVGKGRGFRVLAHVKNALNDYHGKDYRNIEFDNTMEDEISTKSALIREIYSQGLKVEAIIHRRGLDEKSAYEVEAALIDAYPGLINSVKGHGTDRGPIPLEYFLNELPNLPNNELPKATNEETVSIPSLQLNSNKLTEITDKCIIIKIKQETVFRHGIYEGVRSCWRANLEKARRANYVLAVVQGIVEGVFEPTQWYRTTAENVRKYGGFHDENRIAFIGKEADADVKNKYFKKAIPDKFRKQGMAAPVLFTYQ